MRIHILLTAMFLFAAITCPASAGKITADPNAGPSQELQSEETDQRLAQKVTLDITRKTVLSIIDDLTAKTGVAFKAGQNGQDWQVRDRKMNIYCKDLPLANLMNSISRVMKFKWSKEKLKDGKYAYRIYMDRRTLLDEEAKRAREEERLAGLEIKRRQKAFETLAKVGDMAPAELAKLQSDNPFMYMLGTYGLAKPLAGFLREAPAVTQALAYGQAMDLDASSLSSQGKTYLMNSLVGLQKLTSLVEGRAQGFADAMSDFLDSATIRINSNYETMQQRNEGSFMLGEIRVGVGDRYGVQIPLFDPDSSVAKVIGQVLVEAEQMGKPPDQDIEKSLQSKFMEAFASDLTRDIPEESEVQRPDDPALHKKIKVAPKTDGLPDVEAALAKAGEIAVVSDSFSRCFGPPVPRNREMELGDLLDHIGKFFRYDWDKQGGVIELRDKQWFKKRAAQIPEAWLDEWRKTFKETGTLSLDDLGRICSLSFEQFNENIADDETLRPAGVPLFYMAREPMALYATLTDSQRTAVFTGAGLAADSLTPAQLAQLDKTVRPRNSKFAEHLTSLTFTGDQDTKKNGKLAYEFRISGAGDEEPLSWELTEPRYEAPPKPKDDKRLPPTP